MMYPQEGGRLGMEIQFFVSVFKEKKDKSHLSHGQVKSCRESPATWDDHFSHHASEAILSAEHLPHWADINTQNSA